MELYRHVWFKSLKVTLRAKGKRNFPPNNTAGRKDVMCPESFLLLHHKYPYLGCGK